MYFVNKNCESYFKYKTRKSTVRTRFHQLLKGRLNISLPELAFLHL